MYDIVHIVRICCCRVRFSHYCICVFLYTEQEHDKELRKADLKAEYLEKVAAIASKSSSNEDEGILFTMGLVAITYMYCIL